MLGIAVAGVLASPVIVVVSVVVDLAKRRRRLPTARVFLFLLQYAINDSIEILLAPVYWIVAGRSAGSWRSGPQQPPPQPGGRMP